MHINYTKTRINIKPHGFRHTRDEITMPFSSAQIRIIPVHVRCCAVGSKYIAVLHMHHTTDITIHKHNKQNMFKCDENLIEMENFN